MIATDFAANESWDDALLSLGLLFQPWKWQNGDDIEKVERKLIKKLALEQDDSLTISLFLSGRSALYYLLRSLNLPKGSQILVQAFTCEAVVLPIFELGLKPVYLDIETETFSADYQSFKNRLTENCKIVILQHTFGLTPKNREKILKLAKEKKMIVIEDLAHGFSKNIFSTKHQTLNTNHYFLLSFGRSKMLSSVFGGAILGSDNKTMKQFNNLTMPSYAFIFLCLLYKPLTMIIKSTYDLGIGRIMHKIVNRFKLLIPEITSQEKSGGYDKLFNFAYPNALAILLNRQLNKLERVNDQRAKISKIYNSTISLNNEHLIRNHPSLIRFPFEVKNRDLVVKKMREKNIFLGKWYDQVVAPKDIDLSRVGYTEGSCPIAENVCKKIINLPTNIDEQEAQKIVNLLNDVS